MSAARRNASRSARGRQQFENSVVDDLPRALRRDRLDADMVGARLPVFLDAGADRALVAPGHQSVEEAIRTAAGEVFVVKVLAPPAVDVVVELEIAGERLARCLVRLPRVGFEQHPYLGAQQLAGAKDGAGLRRVL